MKNNEPLDQGIHQLNTLPAPDMIKKLQKNGYYNVYEKGNGNIEIKKVPSLQCQLVKEKGGSWKPAVSIDWLGNYVVIPAIVLFVITKYLGLHGFGPLIWSIILGWGIGNVFAGNKKKETLKKLQDLIKE